MPRRNRVTPWGELIAVPDRGMFWGSRGCLHDRDGNLVRYSRGSDWTICVLEFKGRRRQLCAPGRLTELFFLDEATALAAGHRPCGECRVRDYRAFKAAWADAHPGTQVSAPAIDAQLHRDRLRAPGVKRTYLAPLGTLPGGAMIELDGRSWLVIGDVLAEWSPSGYRRFRPRPGDLVVTVLTPRGTVAALAGGYRPALHGSALAEKAMHGPGVATSRGAVGRP
jgi:hypothetical protein